MTYEQLVSRILGRKSRLGIATAFGHMHDVQSCLDGSGSCPWKLLGRTTEKQWRQALKDAKKRLVYHDDEMTVRDESFFSSYKDRVKNEMPPRGLCIMDVITTSTRKDRDGDLLDTRGAEVDMAGPVLWQHMPFEPIGKLLRIVEHTKDFLHERIALIDSPLGNDAAALAEFGALRISHGFIPKEWESLDQKDPAAGFLVKKFEIMERSLVSVPANPDAVILAFSREKLHTPLVKSWAKNLFDARPAQGKGMSLPGKKTCGCGGEKGECTCHGSKAAEEDPCVAEKIKRLMDEGKDRDQAVAIAVNMCKEEKAAAEASYKAGEDLLDDMSLDECPECGGEMVDGMCEDCGYTIKNRKMEYDAPNYRESIRLDQGCGNCTFRNDLMCKKHSFVIKPDYVCDDYSQNGAMAAARPPRIASAKAGRSLNFANEKALKSAAEDLDELMGMAGLPRAAVSLARSAKTSIDGVLSSVAKPESQDMGEPDADDAKYLIQLLTSKAIETGDTKEIESLQQLLASVLDGFKSRKEDSDVGQLLRRLALV